jgi:NADH-quinone oxidoreductase subunit J
MTFTQILFFFFAACAIGCAAARVTCGNPVACAIWLIGTFFSVAAIFTLLGAFFLGIVQVLVYAGAIMVLFLFVIMLLNVPTEDPPTGYHARILGGAGPRRFGAVLSVVLVAELFWAMRSIQATPLAPGAQASSVHDIGVRLFRDYSFAFEATSVLILVAMVGAIVLARKEHS